MKEIFTLTSSLLAMFERFLIIALCMAVILWLYAVIRTNKGNKGKMPLKIKINRSLIEGAMVCIAFLAIYFFIFVKVTGWKRFVWNEWYWDFSRNTYLMLLPEILILVLISIFFFIQNNQLSKQIQKSIKS
ncbi:MAG: hypothetical protein LBG80_13830 [Bacteroidales bacterium]|jgi:hypothetical protein|nr:hypothetical protein [Bacteroidales bacterium]